MDLRHIRREYKVLVRLRSRVQQQEKVLRSALSANLRDFGTGDVARALGYSLPYISNIRSGRVAVSDNFIERLERSRLERSE